MTDAVNGGYTLTATLPMTYVDALGAVRSALADQGFGVLTEIDLAATLKVKLGKDVAAQTILGACRPALAYRALQADPSVAALLPCNVVVREVGPSSSVVEAFDPEAMLSFSTGEAIGEVAADAKQRLQAALGALQHDSGTRPERKES